LDDPAQQEGWGGAARRRSSSAALQSLWENLAPELLRLTLAFGLDRSRGKLMRFLQVEKMRACEHSVEKHALEVRKGSISVLGPIFEAGE